MTDSDPQSNRDQTQPSGAGSLPARVVEWFWRGAALSKQRRDARLPGERAQLLALRACAAADVASVALTSEPLDPFREAIASELYRQSAFWTACALSEEPAILAALTDEARVWDTLDQLAFRPPEGSVETADAVRQLARTGSFAHFAELSPAEQHKARLCLSALSQALLTNFEERASVLKSIRAQRIWRLGLLVSTVLVAVGAVAWAHDAREQRSELTAGKTWRVSSTYGIGGCASPEQQCPGNTGYFFHTSGGDRSPWIEFDLTTSQQVSSVHVENREDCCFERAVPLVIEVSGDRKNWQEVARRDAVFSTWRASFGAVPARWVRLRILKRNAFHLHGVRIYP